MKGYSETLEYLYGLETFGIVFGLDAVTWILSLLGNPHQSFSSVHIAGTNGKGSVASMIAETLSRAGYRTGLYTSPHLTSFTERISVSGRQITEPEVVELTGQIKACVESDGSAHPFTFFDFTTALAFRYFKEKSVDIAIVETGLGGRLDSTNVLSPMVSVITNVDFDHEEYLGTTIESIAQEKAGIVKDRIPAVTGADGAALGIIRATCRERKAPLYALGEAFDYTRLADQVMSYRGVRSRFDELSVGLQGDHQLFNAALALCTLELLQEKGYAIREGAIREGVSRVRWPGRLELIRGRSGRPDVLLDGAHNPQGARALASFLRTHFSRTKKTLVFGVMKDKNYAGMLKELLPVAETAIVTKPNIGRAAEPELLTALAPCAMVTGSVKEALKRAFEDEPDDRLVVVTGSFYTLGEAKKFLEQQE
jgi:dihydrofolate synthase / folylpolyglutamate synthase